ncbi:hypothetical protein [Methylobacterium nigriterrae]|uniref:hypothetical protein n=1 Tax=Methylobacterium nigriterrae TaxID=3127512 RepID=UPI003013D4FD
MLLKTAAATLTVATSLSIGLLSGASAAPATEHAPTRVADAGQAMPAVAGVSDGEDEASTCSRSRRRLWVEGEGWIVRRVTTCR